MKHLGIVSQPQDLVTLEVLRTLSTKWSFGDGPPSDAAGVLGEHYVEANNRVWIKTAPYWIFTGIQFGSSANVAAKSVLVDADIISIGDSANSLQMRQVTIADFKTQFLSASLTDAAAIPDLPAAGTALAWQSIVQTLRNSLKWLTSRFNSSGQLSPAYGGTGTDSLEKLPVSTATKTALDGKLSLTGGPVSGSIEFLGSSNSISQHGDIGRPSSYFWGDRPSVISIDANNENNEYSIFVAIHQGVRYLGALTIGEGGRTDGKIELKLFLGNANPIVFDNSGSISAPGGMRQGPSAPRTAKRLIEGVMPAAGGLATYAHGCPAESIVSVCVAAQYAEGNSYMPANSSSDYLGASYRYTFWTSNDDVAINISAGEGANVAGKPMRIIIEYLI
ncbi:hypothetical protein [Paracidovorax wautersii]|uniref:Uncharacterized protein n=1 Tax=Paracidovorax wautersii TaxID=1177982 RepID=A0A1I2GAW2_9BURK|nr:hypothetical protein [Paracidovorax wautersii]SFF14652.1 hypothetical protein SAMN04489711_11450 [Paracidovorax wautersii]